MLITVTTGNQVLMYEADSNPSIEEWKIVIFEITLNLYNYITFKHLLFIIKNFKNCNSNII